MSTNQAPKDYYGILGVSRTASGDEIKKEFRRLSKKYHPDINKGDKIAEDRFKEINEANSILSKPEKKSAYDLTLPQQQYREGSQTRTTPRNNPNNEGQRNQYYQPKTTTEPPTQVAHEGYQWVVSEERGSAFGRTGSDRRVYREMPLPNQQSPEGKTQTKQGESTQAKQNKEGNARQKKTQETTEATKTETTNSANTSLKVYEGDLAIISAVREISSLSQDCALEVKRPTTDIRKGVSELIAVVEKKGTEIRIYRSIDEFKPEQQREQQMKVNAGGVERVIEPHKRLSEAYFSPTMLQELGEAGVPMPPDFGKYLATLKEVGVEMAQGNYDLRTQRDKINTYSHEGYGRRQEIPFGNIRSEMQQAEGLVQIKLQQTSAEGQARTGEQQQYRPPEGGI